MAMRHEISWADIESLETEFKQAFWYSSSATGTALAATVGATAEDTITFGQESDFICTALMSWDEEGYESLNYWLFDLIPQDSGRNMMNLQLPIWAATGSGQRPHILPAPRIFWRNTTLSLRYQNRTANAKTIFIILGGFKVYYDLNQLNLTRGPRGRV